MQSIFGQPQSFSSLAKDPFSEFDGFSRFGSLDDYVNGPSFQPRYDTLSDTITMFDSLPDEDFVKLLTISNETPQPKEQKQPEQQQQQQQQQQEQQQPVAQKPFYVPEPCEVLPQFPQPVAQNPFYVPPINAVSAFSQADRRVTEPMQQNPVEMPAEPVNPVMVSIDYYVEQFLRGDTDAAVTLGDIYYSFVKANNLSLTKDENFANALYYYAVAADKGNVLVVAKLEKLYNECVDKANMVEILINDYRDKHNVIQTFIDNTFASYSHSSIAAWKRLKRANRIKKPKLKTY